MAVGGSSSAGVNGYPARRPMRAVLLAVILSTAAGLVWFSVLHQTESGCPSRRVENPGVENPSADPAATAAATSSQRLPANGLDTVPPAPPQFTRVQVLNANGVRGEATIVDGALAQLGFAPTTTPANDPQYPAFDLHCYGEIRFGAAGQAAARTLSLAVPCAELVRDGRPDATVDLALGTKFIALQPNDTARTALLDLAGLEQPVPARPSRSGLAAQTEPQEMTQVGPTSMAQSITDQPVTQSVPVVNPDLLRRARQVKC
ncbi:MAG TPA: envelope integrity protein Cei [Pseudonocardiaceae bacterium]|nr:envelope integrity protein Cei [Pseudonocardiaceae bacterium]